jgi:hypothetical protein
MKRMHLSGRRVLRAAAPVVLVAPLLTGGVVPAQAHQPDDVVETGYAVIVDSSTDCPSAATEAGDL